MMRLLYRIVIMIVALSISACGAHTSNTPISRPPNHDPLKSVTASALFEEGKVLASTGDYVRAEQYYRAAVAQGYPKDRVIPYIINACIAASRMHDALQHARPYLQEHPDDWRLRQLVAFILMAVSEYLEAETELVRVIYDAPDQALPHYALAVLYRDQLGNPTMAIQHFLKYVEIDPKGRHAAESKHAAQQIQFTQKGAGKNDSPRRI